MEHLWWVARQSVGGRPPDERLIGARVLSTALDEIRSRRTTAGVLAALLSGPDCPVRPQVVRQLLRSTVDDALTGLVRGGWTAEDLRQLGRRRLEAGHQRLLAAAITAGGVPSLDLHAVDGLEAALAIAASVVGLPPMPDLPAVGPPALHAVADDDVRRLAKVRALLAKAESTDYAEEAEALSAKAQELVTRYALDRLVAAHDGGDGAGRITMRRIWLDPPYAFAKATLVDAVGRANRCRAVVSESIGFLSLVGDGDDLEATELLATSLLVQASTAMIAAGRSAGTARSRSFRQAFLLAYASRIGQRLAAAADGAVEDTPRRHALVPALRRHEEAVDRAFEEAFPTVRTRRPSAVDTRGWVAGTAAADHARLDT